MKMDEHSFCREVLLEPFWVSKLRDSRFHDRPRLISAFRKLIKRAGDDLDYISGEVLVFSPPPNATGTFLSDPLQKSLLYLSPCLDSGSQAFVDYTVAHEFAHAVVYATDRVNIDCSCGEREDCYCHDCACEGCKNFDLERTPEDVMSPEEYVNTPSEYEADSLVLEWGFKLPAWKIKLRGRRPKKRTSIVNLIESQSNLDRLVIENNCVKDHPAPR